MVLAVFVVVVYIIVCIMMLCIIVCEGDFVWCHMCTVLMSITF